MSSRRPAVPSCCPIEPDAAAWMAVPWRAGLPRLPLAVCVSLVALTASGAALAATPLPPSKPKGLQAPSSPVVARVPLMRSAPLPPPRPPELSEDEAEPEPEVAGQRADQQQEQSEGGSADGFVREPARSPAGPRVASRQTEPEAALSGAAVPLPPERPATPGAPRVPAGAPAIGAPAGGAAPAVPMVPMVMPAACADLVAEGEIEASLDTTLSSNPACGAFAPVRLTAIRLGDGRMIPLKPAAVSRCEMTVAVSSWMREQLAPAVAAAGGALAAIRIADSYDCRPRNRIAGAKMSEHGRGNAVDVGGFELGDGRVWTVVKAGLPMPLRASMKDSACTRFTTVLGPGSDGYHEDHIHVDLAQRRNDYKLCSWNLDVGNAVASRKDKPDASAPSAEGRAAQGKDGEAAAADKDAAGASAEDADAAKGAEAAPVPPPKGGAGGGKTTPPGKGSPPNGGAWPKDAQSRETKPKNTEGKNAEGKNAQPKNAQPKNAQSKDGNSKGAPPKQGQSN